MLVSCIFDKIDRGSYRSEAVSVHPNLFKLLPTSTFRINNTLYHKNVPGRGTFQLWLERHDSLTSLRTSPTFMFPVRNLLV